MDENIVERKKPKYMETYERLDKECMWTENSLRDQSMYPESNLYKVCLKNYLKAKRELDEYNNKLNALLQVERLPGS